MHKKLYLPALSLLALALAGCGTTPENTGLVAARAQYETLQANPEASRLAALETRDAFAALDVRLLCASGQEDHLDVRGLRIVT